MTNYTFANPEFFWGLLAIPLLVAWHLFSRKKQVAHVLNPSVKAFTKSGSLPKWQLILVVLRMIAIALIVVALARPQTQDVSTQTKTNKGIDIVMAIDVSSSMLARDSTARTSHQTARDAPPPRCSLALWVPAVTSSTFRALSTRPTRARATQPSTTCASSTTRS